MIHLSCGYALGDAVAMTGAVRDLRISHPDLVIHPPFTDLYPDELVSRSKCPGPDIRVEYPLRHHLVEAHRVAIEKLFPEVAPIHRGPNVGFVPGPFDFRPVPTNQGYWVVIAGGKHGIETKWWPWWQQLVNLMVDSGRTVVQLGHSAADEWHEPLTGTVNLVGQTTIRQYASALHHCAGLISPITSAIHLIRATGNTKSPLIVVAGGREPPLLFRYPNQVVFHHDPSVLPCAHCWAARCKVLDPAHNATFAPCMTAIRPELVFQELHVSPSQYQHLGTDGQNHPK